MSCDNLCHCYFIETQGARTSSTSLAPISTSPILTCAISTSSYSLSRVSTCPVSTFYFSSTSASLVHSSAASISTTAISASILTYLFSEISTSTVGSSPSPTSAKITITSTVPKKDPDAGNNLIKIGVDGWPIPAWKKRAPFMLQIERL